MKSIIITLLLLPGIVSAQKIKTDYAIYSQYLSDYQAKKKNKKIWFVVRESSDYLRKYDTTGIRDIITELRNYLKGDPVSTTNVKFQYRSFADTLKKDTMWMPLIAELERKTKLEFVLKNEFSKKLHTSIINNSEYDAYFKIKDFRKRWPAFYAHYPKTAVLVEFSEIVSDGKRAVFYFTASYGDLGGQGYIVFGYKEKNKWKFISTHPLWQS